MRAISRLKRARRPSELISRDCNTLGKCESSGNDAQPCLNKRLVMRAWLTFAASMAMNISFRFYLLAFLACRHHERLDRLMVGEDAFRIGMSSWIRGVGSPGRGEVRRRDC